MSGRHFTWRLPIGVPAELACCVYRALSRFRLGHRVTCRLPVRVLAGTRMSHGGCLLGLWLGGLEVVGLELKCHAVQEIGVHTL